MANAVTLLGMWKWSCKVVCTRDGIKVGSIRSLHPGSVEEEAEEKVPFRSPNASMIRPFIPPSI